DAHAAVTGGDPVIRVLRIHPDVVAVAAAAPFDRERLPAVHRSVERAIGHEHLVGIRGIHHDPDVVTRAADERAIPAHDAPRRTPAPPEPPTRQSTPCWAFGTSTTMRSGPGGAIGTSFLRRGVWGTPVPPFSPVAPPSRVM